MDIGLLSIVMSTIDSFFFISSMTISNDLMNNKKKSSNKIALILTGIISYIIAINFDFVIDIWYIFGSIGASCLLIPFIKILYKPKTRIHYPLATLLIPGILCIIWIYMKNPFRIDCLYVGVLTSIVMNFYSYRIKPS